MERKQKILVIGDVMLDVYIYGKADRLSPEAPCPVMNECLAPQYKLGGAANVAFQIAQSGFEVALWGYIAHDYEGQKIIQLLATHSISNLLIEGTTSHTTTKTRYLAGNNQQLLRVDRDSEYRSTKEESERLISKIADYNFDIVIISDYSKGILSHQTSEMIIKECRRLNIPTIVDIKNDALKKYHGATLLKGNRDELEKLFSDLSVDGEQDMESRLKAVCDSLDTDCVIMTCGNKGISAYSRSEGFTHSDARKVPIHDVTGAGDVVTAFIGMLHTDKRYSFSEKVAFANHAAHKKVSQVGTGIVTLDDVLFNGKCTSADNIRRIRGGKRIVFTNGCFDVIHAGHIHLLNKAKQHGDILIVGLNSDDSVSRLKGEKRPVNNFESRAEVLSSLTSVDYIIEFGEDTPKSLIESLNPDVLVKGGDYKESEIVGAEYVKQNGGEVIIVPLMEGKSTTNILKNLGYE